MKKIALTTIALGVSLAAPCAMAQENPNPNCPPGSWLCADITIGGAPMPPPVIVAPPPPPPRVIILPPRPRIFFRPPPPMYYVPPPPPVVVYQPAPVYTPPPPTYIVPPPTYYLPPPRPRGYVGIEAAIGGSWLASSGATNSTPFLGGVSGGLRFRSSGHIGIEMSVGAYGGHDYNGDSRTEIPLALTGLLYFNPQNRLQFYGLLGIGASFASVTYDPANYGQHPGLTGANYTYLGGSAGLGAELQISRHFSLFADVRGFVRGRVDDGTSTNPEFTRSTPSGGTQTTNTSGGALSQLGAILYF